MSMVIVLLKKQVTNTRNVNIIDRCKEEKWFSKGDNLDCFTKKLQNALEEFCMNAIAHCHNPQDNTNTIFMC